jgi:hypothetical protein
VVLKGENPHSALPEYIRAAYDRFVFGAFDVHFYKIRALNTVFVEQSSQCYATSAERSESKAAALFDRGRSVVRLRVQKELSRAFPVQDCALPGFDIGAAIQLSIPGHKGSARRLWFNCNHATGTTDSRGYDGKESFVSTDIDDGASLANVTMERLDHVRLEVASPHKSVTKIRKRIDPECPMPCLNGSATKSAPSSKTLRHGRRYGAQQMIRSDSYKMR